MTEIVVRIDPCGQDELKVTWYEAGMPHEPYNIDRGLLKRVSNDNRVALQRLVIASSEETPSQAKIAKELRALAIEGYNLYRVILPPGDKAALRVRNWLDNELPDESHEVCFSVPPRIVVPWALCFSGNPACLDGIEDPSFIAQHRAFWGVKYRVAALLYKLRPHGVEQPRSAANFLVLAAAHQATWNRVKASLVGTPVDILASQFFDARWQPVFTIKDLLANWTKHHAERHVDLVYLYCHANGTYLAVEDDRLLSDVDVTLHMERVDASKERPPSIFFLNGCETAVGDLDGGFLEATGGRGFCGFVGTEAKVPERMAYEFGVVFFDELVNQRKSLGEAVESLRKRYWPAGLAFSLSCPPRIRVQ